MNTRPRESGLSLVELLIAMTLGLVLVIAVGSVFVGSRQTYRTQEGFSQMQESGRFSHYFLTSVIRLAGYVPAPREHTTPTEIFRNDNYRALRGWESEAPDMPGIGTASDEHDAISVSYAGSPDGTVRDCFGGVVRYSLTPAACAAAASNQGCQIVSNTLYLNQATPPDLMCKSTRYNCTGTLTDCVASTASGDNPGPQPFLSGVADLQLRYGVDDNNDQSVDQWLDADDVVNWNRVMAVEVTVIAESVDTVGLGEADSDFVVDGRLRRPFTTTIAIRNRLLP